MKKGRILPKMALKGIITNGMVYYPYIVAGIFSVFIFFVFSSIRYNDLTKNLPYAPYALIFMEMGRELLFIILWLFLFYAGSFVTKRRKKEIGLYNLLGLEKTHIGMMLLIENIMLYAIIAAGGILLGTVLAKLMFLILLKVSSMPVDVAFTFSPQAFTDTLAGFGVIFLYNFMVQLFGIGRSKGTDLLSAGKRGEKEPRFLPLWSFIGVAILISGYAASINSRADEMIFINFFMAVFLVVIGTYLVFTSGSVLFFKLIRRSKKIYYQADNFITISGMFYRMKKNAAGLSNICIFSTMTLITLICTLIVGFGVGEVSDYLCPYDMAAEFHEGSLYTQHAQEKLRDLEEKYDVSLQRADFYDVISLTCSKEENSFGPVIEDDENKCRVIFMTLATYDLLTGGQNALTGDDVLIYTNGVDFAYKSLDFMGVKANIEEEVQELFPYPKAAQNKNPSDYVIITADEAQRDVYVSAWAKQNGVEDIEAFLRSGRQKIGVLLTGDEEEKKAFIADFTKWCEKQSGFIASRNELYDRRDLQSMYGGLLFIGVIFGFIFFMCLIIIMYYKQISEGYEDQGGFSIMKKVGMGDDEIKSTIRKQILCVFGLPLAGALLHTFVGMFMVRKLMATISFFNSSLMTACSVAAAAAFALVYVFAYLVTARTYYRIVDR